MQADTILRVDITHTDSALKLFIWMHHIVILGLDILRIVLLPPFLLSLSQEKHKNKHVHS